MRPLGDELGEALRAELLGWPGVTPRPMMGTLSFFRGKRMLGCYVSRDLVKKSPKPPWVNRSGEPPFAWIRLHQTDQQRALGRPGVRKEWSDRQRAQPGKARASRLGFAGWVEVELGSRAALEEAVRWFGCAYEHPPAAPRKRKPKHRAVGRRRLRSK